MNMARVIASLYADLVVCCRDDEYANFVLEYLCEWYGALTGTALSAKKMKSVVNEYVDLCYKPLKTARARKAREKRVAQTLHAYHRYTFPDSMFKAAELMATRLQTYLHADHEA